MGKSTTGILGSSIRATLLAGSMLAFASGAWGQTAPTTTPQDDAAQNQGGVQTTRNEQGDIIVTARHYVPQGSITASKTDIPLIETPQSVSVITRDQIDLLSFVDTQQAVRYTAGAFGENYGPDPRYDFITVRGFTPKQYIDGLAVPATTTISSTGVDLYAFQSLDILKGPSSVLYGAAPPGGILNEVSRRPESTFGGEVNIKGGTDHFGEISTTVTGPVNDYFDVRFTGLYRDAHTDIDDTRTKRLFAAPAATLKLGDSTKLTGLLYYQYDKDTGGSGGFLPLYGTLRPNPTGLKVKRSNNLDDPASKFERHQTGVGFDFEHRFSHAVAFHSNAKWSNYDEQTPIGIYSGGGFVNTTDPSLPSYYRTLQQYNFSYAERVTSFAADNRLDAKLNTGAVEQKFLLGVDYRNVRNFAAYNFVFAGTLDAFDPVHDPAFQVPIGYPTRYNQQILKQTGVYGQDQIGIGNLFILLSGRYDWVNAQTAAAYGSVNDAPVYSGQKQHKFTYRIGANYVTRSGLAPYVSYATSFEPVLGTNTAGDPLKPTSVKQIEGGLKFDARGLPSDIKLFATIAGFNIKEQNFVVPQVGQTPVGAAQGGLVEVNGAELEIVSRIREQLSINASYSYNHSEVKSTPDASTAMDLGAPLPTTPKHKASIFVDYTFQRGALAGFGLGGGVRYNSKSAGGLPSTSGGYYIVTGDATLFDAIVHYDIPGWRFAVNGSNLFDKDYIARCTGLYGCVYGAGRQVLATVTKRF